MQAIDYRLEDHGRTVLDPLIRYWWNDSSFATPGRLARQGHGPLRVRRHPGAGPATHLDPQAPVDYDNFMQSAQVERAQLLGTTEPQGDERWPIRRRFGGI